MSKARLTTFLLFLFLVNLLILARFFYWQIISGDRLSAIAQQQRLQLIEISAPRGKIYSADNYPLVLNKPAFLLYAYLPELEKSIPYLSQKMAPILIEEERGDEEATSSSKTKAETIKEEKELIEKRLSGENNWTIIKRRISEEKKKKIESLGLKGIGFEEESIRDYPEASMAAHLLGFVGFDDSGRPKGYFGLEGFYNQQLSGAPGLLVEEKNVFGQPIFSGKRMRERVKPGLNLTLHLERPAQFILEEELKRGIKRYGAKTGWGVILEPKEGTVLAMASFPNYYPGDYSSFEESLYSNPIIAQGFEPGSVFKPLIMAAALEEEAVEPETKCSSCSGPRVIGEYTIRTWNDQYHPDCTMREVIQNSDNVGMVFVSDQLGKEKILDYIKKYGFGQKTGIDLQEEAALPLRPDNQWYPIDLATLSFGQGILVTPIQLTRAFIALASDGRIVEPKVVSQVWSNEGTQWAIKGKTGKKILSQKTVEEIKEMMVNAVEHGEAKWAKPEKMTIAGKTGTAQIPIQGHYDQEKTIASFIGFAPAEDPKFLMLISLREPTSSPWGSETAAPLWFETAQRLAYYWNL